QIIAAAPAGHGNAVHAIFRGKSHMAVPGGIHDGADRAPVVAAPLGNASNPGSRGARGGRSAHGCTRLLRQGSALCKHCGSKERATNGKTNRTTIRPDGLSVSAEIVAAGGGQLPPAPALPQPA